MGGGGGGGGELARKREDVLLRKGVDNPMHTMHLFLAMLSPLFVSTSGVTIPLFLAKPLLNLQTVQAHLFRQSSYVFIFNESPLKIRFFSGTQKN